MKATITINLGGKIFHIDDDAYEMLHAYLVAVEQQFLSDDERKEVMSDVEIRLSELFAENLGKNRDVIMKSDVNKVIEIMGEPKDFTDTEEEKTNNQKKNYSCGSQHKYRKLYRDPDNRILGGVCGGLGAYFNIDRVIFRIIFIIASCGAGAGIIIYLILFIVTPEATTAAQKLEMKGNPITLENIIKIVREEFKNIYNNMKSS
ncbi:MAG: PspC domain-containing protein [Bacteroidales bacterium]|nr:PspC domain-containing protein [Bacteroidales bacterium]